MRLAGRYIGISASGNPFRILQDSITLEELTRQAEDREIQQLMTALNLVELKSRATALHNGVTCHVESSAPDKISCDGWNELPRQDCLR